MISDVILFIVIFIILVGVLFLGTPVSLGIGFVGVAGIILLLDPALLKNLCMIAFNQSTSVTTMMIPLFILMAEFLANSNIAADLFEVINRRLKKLPANIAVASVVTSTIFSALCGSAPATAVTIGRISIPSMLKYGYNPRIAGGTQAAAGNMGIITPPSITLIIYGIITETSIVKLFMAGVIPGIMVMFMMIAYLVIRAKVDKNMIIPPKDIVTQDAEIKYSAGRDILTVVPMVALIGIVFIIMYTGVATATECAALGVVGAFIIVLVLRRFSKDLFKKSMLQSTSSTCMILFLMFGGLAFSMFLTVEGMPQTLSAIILESSPNRWVTLIIVMALFLLIGLFMDPIPCMYIILPFTFPFISTLGFDPIWFGIVLTLCCSIGMVTPPVGLNLFVLRGATGISMTDLIRGVLPYVVILFLAVAILFVFPGIVTALPNSMNF